jgi:ferritin
MTKMNWEKANKQVYSSEIYVPTDNASVQKAKNFFANGMKNIVEEDIAYSNKVPDGYFKFNGMNIQLTQIDKLIKKVQMM